ncbi:MAG: type IV toxin-antitoxin system AbiEi family antitoxin domain-containing protein [Terriglobales bacterium]
MVVILHIAMEPQARILRLAQKKRLFRLSEATAVGVHPEHVRRLTRRGELTRVGRGLYALPTIKLTEHHTLAEVAKRVPKATFCLLTALRFHSLGTENPREVWLAVDRRAGIPRVDFTPVRTVRVSGAALAGGIEVHNIDGVKVRVTSPARTVADCFKFRNRIGIDVAVEALRDYRRLRKGTVDDLWREAHRLRVAKVMRPYWDGMS